MQYKSVNQYLNEAMGIPPGADMPPQPEPAFGAAITMDDLIALKIDKVPMLFGDIIPAAALWSLVGPSDSCKSMLLRQAVIDLVTGNDFLGWKNNAKHFNGLFIATEDDAASTAYLLSKQVTTTQRRGVAKFYFGNEDIPEFLEQELSRHPYDLIAIDAFGDIFRDDLKDSTRIRKTLNQYHALALKYQCSICFLHHTGKRTERLAPDKSNSLGGQGFEAKMRLMMELRVDTADLTKRHLCIVKGNYTSNEQKLNSFVLEFNPDNFTLTNTGNRVPFKKVAPADTDDAAAGKLKKNTPFNAIEAQLHSQLVAEVFEGREEYKYSELYQLLGQLYADAIGEVFGRDRSRQLLGYLSENGYIQKSGIEGHSVYRLVKEDDA